jgi:hypothetical protein
MASQRDQLTSAANTELLLREVVPSDFAQWKPLWDGYNAFYGRKDQTALPEEITQRTWSRFFDAYEPLHLPSAPGPVSSMRTSLCMPLSRRSRAN